MFIGHYVLAPCREQRALQWTARTSHLCPWCSEPRTAADNTTSKCEKDKLSDEVGERGDRAAVVSVFNSGLVHLPAGLACQLGTKG